ncbi:DUF4270 domain-containing protein [Flammeovirga yaeyamensis]|uniref:DUF4270 domain-containing protein n=1 Tax=Flammeovirga yaeyamensis TaxID=367791 RepID=A0AAX1N875_9BACT|nr:DUF4270 family protein [Flammeovirga yaeyamensis]MBB3698853.1 hypothetical protein [Flammeovirga yaeyamensis]NMF37438.1 DUF4270 domain-containing protein [Flammeovirga yaeyamensis]QWG03749.1 DUF4270 domain-containing protein [Flammeovirga yaeyamensis]
MSNKFLLKAFSLIFITLSFSCTRTDLQTIVIGGDLIDDQTKMCYVDTLEIEIQNMHVDSIITKNSNYFLAGYIDEGTKIGKTTTATYTQLSIGSEEGLNFEDRTLDSIEFAIALERTSIYGDTSKNITLEVYEITEDIEGDSVLYFAEDSVATDANAIGFRTFKPSDIGSTDTVRITLDKAFGQKIIDNAEYADQEDFRSKIKGLAIKVRQGQESAWCGKYSLDNFGTVVTMNMSYMAENGEDTLRTQYYFGFSQRFNQIKYEPGTLTSGINVGDIVDTEQTNNLGYVIEGTGMVASLRFPTLIDLFKKPQGVDGDSLREVHLNRADLIISPVGVNDDQGRIFPDDNTPPPLTMFFGFREGENIKRISDDNRNYRYLQAQSPASGDQSISYSGNIQAFSHAKLAQYLQERTINEFYDVPLSDDGLVIIPAQQNQNVRKLFFADDKSTLLNPLNGQTMRMRLVVYYAVFNDESFQCK